jgi:cytochrome c-type biogenesis protein
MTLLILSFLAGVLTVAAPCILPLLPIVIGGSLSAEKDERVRMIRPIVVTLSLAISVIVFTLLLKASTSLLQIPQYVWQIIAGGIVILLGLNFLFPMAWKLLSARSGLYTNTNKTLGKTLPQTGLKGSVLTGAALGPVFNSCSPTYLFIVASILPASFATGFAYLVAYAIGLSLMLLLVAYFGQSIVYKLGWLTNPSGWFLKTMGVVFIIVGIFVLFGVDKMAQTFILDQGWYDPISNLEKRLR